MKCQNVPQIDKSERRPAWDDALWINIELRVGPDGEPQIRADLLIEYEDPSLGHKDIILPNPDWGGLYYYECTEEELWYSLRWPTPKDWNFRNGKEKRLSRGKFPLTPEEWEWADSLLPEHKRPQQKILKEEKHDNKS